MIRNNKQQPERDTCMDRIPFASLIAAAMTFTGTIVFCCFTYASIDAVLKMMRDLLNIEYQQLNYLRSYFIIIGVATALVVVGLVAMGFLSTGVVRRRRFGGVRAALGGRAMLGVFMVIIYIMLIAWIFALCVNAVAIVLHYVLDILCDDVIGKVLPKITEAGAGNFDNQRTIDQQQAQQCGKNYSDYLERILGTLKLHIFENTRNKVQSAVQGCQQVQKFCQLSETSSSGFVVGFFSAFVVVLGWVHFMCCSVANSIRIELARKEHELYEVWEMETRPSNHPMAMALGPDDKDYMNGNRSLHASQHPVQRGTMQPMYR